MNAAEEFAQLQTQETLLLARVARFQEALDATRLELAKVRANLAGAKLGERLAEERAAEPAAADPDDLERQAADALAELQERVERGDPASTPEIAVVMPDRGTPDAIS